MPKFNKISEIYQGFQLTKFIPLPELNCIFRELIHLNTGAQILHVENDDPENLFCLSFPNFTQNF